MKEEEQIAEISNLLLEYSAGNYEYQGDISDQVNELDMIISGINMLGEELLSTNVSKEYFSSIFNAVTDLVLIIGEQGNLLDVNKAAEERLEISRDNLQDLHIDQLVLSPIFDTIQTELINGSGHSFVKEEILQSASNTTIYGLFTCSKIIDRFGVFKGYLISIKDITEQKENEKVILKTIFTTQQREQKRVADDLHDSIGQELSMTKLMISNLKNLCKDDKQKLELIETSTEILDSSIRELREICFNLMPGVLSKGGLELAVQDLIAKLEMSQNMEVNCNKNQDIPRLDPDLEVVIYRIIQEFINNMIKHAEATKLNIAVFVDTENNRISVNMQDNGKGFDLKKLNKVGENRGYENLKSKVKAFNGELQMNSKIGTGTMTKVEFPINPQ